MGKVNLANHRQPSTGAGGKASSKGDMRRVRQRKAQGSGLISRERLKMRGKESGSRRSSLQRADCKVSKDLVKQSPFLTRPRAVA